VKAWIEESAPDEASINSIVDICSGNERNVKAILRKKDMTALNYAAFYGKIDIIKLLMEHGAGKNAFRLL
jgi:ankyrin repeat protein